LQKGKYKVLIIPSGQRDMDDIKDHKILVGIKKALISLSDEPRPMGSIKLLGKDDGYRIRIKTYRCCYRIDDNEKSVFIYRIKHRKEVYRHL